MNDRRSHQCHADGCDSPSVWEVRLRCWTKHSDVLRKPIEFECPTTLRVCDAHRKRAEDYLLSPLNKTNFNSTVLAQNLPPIDWDRAKVEYLPLPKDPPVIVNITRQILKCDFGNDDNTAQCPLPAKYQMAFRVFQIGSNTVKIDVLTNVCCCSRHRKMLKVDDMMTPEQKSTLVGTLAHRGFAMPDFKRTQLRFTELQEGRKVDPAAFERKGA